MRKMTIAAVVAAATIAFVGGTFSASAFTECTRHDGQLASNERITVESMKQKISDLGYDVRRLKRERGGYEARLVERKSGGAVKALFDGRTGELVRAQLRD